MLLQEQMPQFVVATRQPTSRSVPYLALSATSTPCQHYPTLLSPLPPPLPALADLDLGANELPRLPPQVLDCTALTRLALDANELLVRCSCNCN